MCVCVNTMRSHIKSGHVGQLDEQSSCCQAASLGKTRLCGAVHQRKTEFLERSMSASSAATMWPCYRAWLRHICSPCHILATAAKSYCTSKCYILHCTYLHLANGMTILQRHHGIISGSPFQLQCDARVNNSLSAAASTHSTRPCLFGPARNTALTVCPRVGTYAVLATTMKREWMVPVGLVLQRATQNSNTGTDLSST